MSGLWACVDAGSLVGFGAKLSENFARAAT